MAAYYNEIDPYAAQWLRNLIAAGHIAPGDVDERSIEDVHPDDLRPYIQCHFFAGIGVWSHALRRAGWPDDRPVWTGSCPCQPFSAAGAGAGFDDERHLWPDFHWLIRERRPAVVFGEQVASKNAEPWLDLVQADLEAMAYAFGAIPFPAAGVGAPHIRDRLYWVADSGRAGLEERGSNARVLGGPARRKQGKAAIGASVCLSDRMADPGSQRRNGERLQLQQGQQRSAGAEAGRRIEACRMADADGRNTIPEREQRRGQQRQQPQDSGALQDGPAGPVNGLWSDADWLFCRDGKWRPVEPGTFPLADGAASRVGLNGSNWRAPAGEEKSGNRIGRLRAYGNAINAEAARVFIEAYLDATNG